MTDLNPRCSVPEERQTHEVPAPLCAQAEPTRWWPEIREPVTDRKLLRLVASAIRTIEEEGFGKVDTLGEPRGNTFHFHLQVEPATFQRFLADHRGFSKSELMQFVLDELHTGRASMLYHTEE